MPSTPNIPVTKTPVKAPAPKPNVDMTDLLAGKEPAPKKNLPTMHIRPTDNGAFTVEHESPEQMPNPASKPPSRFAFVGVNKLKSHIDEHYGDKKAAKPASKSAKPAQKPAYSKPAPAPKV